MPVPSATPTVLEADEVFTRVVAGVDGTAAALSACEQAVRLAVPGAAVDAVAVVHLAEAVHAGLHAPEVADQLQQEADAALADAQRILGARGTCRAVNGFVTAALLREIDSSRATLLALGAHHHTRAAEIVLGGPLGELVHRASCSVLVSRPVEDPRVFPRSLVVGVDDSPAGAFALAVALRLAERFACRLERVEAREHPVDALVTAAHDADLLVVGSRGLHGFRALGSVSERVVHQAPCSVLVARPREHA